MFSGSSISNPFPGLRAFEEDEDILFFGREKQVDELLTKLRTTRFLAVIGSSGSGKSSLIKSGLIPALHSGFMSGAGSLWRICSFRPSNDPIGNVAKALAAPGVLVEGEDDEHEIAMQAAINESILRRSSTGLVAAYKQSGIDPKQNLLVLVDQFEELFRFSKYEKNEKDGKRDSVAFINLLLKAAEQREVPIYVVFTMRSDFLGDCTEFRGLPEAINNGDYLVPRMTREERKDAITGPVSVAGAAIAPRLLNQLLNDVGDNPDQLPILQHALMRTWDVWKKKNVATALDLEEYEEIGTMKHALSQHAEEAYAELTTDRQKHICEVLFKTLTDRGSDSRGIRRPRRLGEICALAEASKEELVEVINVFRKSGRAFLMPPEKVLLTEASIIDISHESIMRVWSRLIDWVDEENESAQVYFRLCEAALTYEEGRGGLWRDPELQIAWKWKEENKPNEIWASRYNNQFSKAMAFLEYSKQQFDLELKHKEELQKQKLKKAKRAAVIISLVAIGALFLAIYAFGLKNLATRQTKLANKKTIEAEQQKTIAVKQTKIAELNRSQALQQKGIAEKNEEEALNQRNIADQQRMQAERSRQDALTQKGIAEEQKTAAVQQKDRADVNAQLAKEQQGIAEKQTEKAVLNENIAREEQRVSTRLKDLASARNLAFQALLFYNEKKYKESKDDAIEAYRLNEKNAGPLQNSDIYNALHQNWVNQVQNRNQFTRHALPVHTITGKPGTNILFTADESGIIYAIESRNDGLVPIAQINVQQEIRSLSCSPDGNMLAAVTAKGTGILFEISTSNALREISRFHFNGVGKTVLFASNTIFYVVSGAALGRYSIQGQTAKEESVKQGSIASITLGKSGKMYIASGNKIMVYDQWSNVFDKAADNYTLNSQITSIAVDPDERVIAAGTYNGSVWIRDMKSKQETSQAVHLSGVNDLAFAKLEGNRLQLASAGADQVIKLILVDQLLKNKIAEDILTLSGHTKWVYGLYYSPDGKHLFSCSEDTKVIGWRSGMESLYQTLNAKK